jgi:DegV family protein with EDD domain
MDYSLIVDSCCDLTPELAERLQAVSIPLTMTLGDTEYIDDQNLDLPGFMADMSACTERVRSAAPPPQLFENAMFDTQNSFVVTLSSKLSTSYENALLAARGLATKGLENFSTHVFDSKSALAGETLIAIKIRELLNAGIPHEGVVQKVTEFISGMKTLFVLDRYDNLIKSGRLHSLASMVINLLNIRLIMGDDGDGNIAVQTKTRGSRKVLPKLLNCVEACRHPAHDERLVISHCNNPEFAAELREAIETQLGFKETLVVPAGGVSSIYADEGGVVLAF